MIGLVKSVTPALQTHPPILRLRPSIAQGRWIDMLALTSPAPAPFPANILAQNVPLSPVVVLVLCVVAGVGTVLLLPSKREASFRKIGGVVLLAAGLIFA